MTPILPIDSSYAPGGLAPVVVPPAKAAEGIPVRAGKESHRAQLDALLELCAEQQASDVHLTGGEIPYFRICNSLTPMGDQLLSPHDVEQMAESLMTDHQ